MASSNQCYASRAPHNLSHLAIGVSDMDASLVFYRDVLGLKLVVDKIEVMTRPEFRTERRGCYLRWAQGDDEAFIVLDQTLDSTKPRGAAKPLFEIGCHHFGFWVEDVDTIVERARAAGQKVHMAPIDTDSGGYGEPAGRPIRVAMLSDPDGNFVQIDQRNG
jgi:catechol 2,3-dioxygenase-like lactoylglutathione lyase family enzyme